VGYGREVIKTFLLAAPQFLRWESVMNALLPIEAEVQETATREEGTTAAAYQATAEARRDRRCHITC